MAYLTQAVQSREYPVPLVAGEKALTASLRYGCAPHDGRHPLCPGTVLPERNRDACSGHPGHDDAHPDGRFSNTICRYLPTLRSQAKSYSRVSRW